MSGVGGFVSAGLSGMLATAVDVISEVAGASGMDAGDGEMAAATAGEDSGFDSEDTGNDARAGSDFDSDEAGAFESALSDVATGDDDLVALATTEDLTSDCSTRFASSGVSTRMSERNMW